MSSIINTAQSAISGFPSLAKPNGTQRKPQHYFAPAAQDLFWLWVLVNHPVDEWMNPYVYAMEHLDYADTTPTELGSAAYWGGSANRFRVRALEQGDLIGVRQRETVKIGIDGDYGTTNNKEFRLSTVGRLRVETRIRALTANVKDPLDLIFEIEAGKHNTPVF